ncbi:flavin-binding monooxygenase-like protein (macronuclear) [Tetrahymena thermophila SB210]|uniref:Flavin-binding monooxygenase-like protein n=1 Tax=Tetrahymena thermophila (strain SB210) TaxID=312017 RepID=Q239B6_TETTS|nr:flavin-binding monooxygenase-like protein [Tetrahymena thermophila SB210]EAR93054.2 flavin-binding monooxygenase-like protein [Tetrahymena thermophila SB210]|eukprot:XP_001013299.2 flavin-binding monooxygenase-like protein [Tetrahymena thermophila SB210]
MENNPETRYKSNYHQKSIVIIGAGPCGILSVKHLQDKANILCVDAKEDIGGLWHFDNLNELNHPNLEKNAFYKDLGVLHSSMYENLITNLPKFLMTYKGFPVKQQYDEFMTSVQFFEYLQDYCQHFNLKKHMLFKTYVQVVRLSKNLSEDERKQIGFEVNKKFLIEISSSQDYQDNVRYIQADSVIVASGRTSKPNMPQIENEEIFKGHKLHMHYFREETMKNYENKHLVVYGCALSAQDIVWILLKKTEPSKQPKQITVIGNAQHISILQKSTSYKEEFASNKLKFVPTYIKKFDSSNSVELQSGEKIENIDCFLYTTGYQYSYPFLEKYSNIDSLIEFQSQNSRRNCFGPLYKKMFCIKEPQIVFLGCITNTVSIQQGLERQSIAACQYLTGRVELPTQEEMMKEYEQELSTTKAIYGDCRDFFKVSLFVGLNEFLYFRSLAQLCKMEYDSQFEDYVLNVAVPIMKQIFLNGEYPQLKSQVFSDKLPENYSPPTNLF